MNKNKAVKKEMGHDEILALLFKRLINKKELFLAVGLFFSSPLLAILGLYGVGLPETFLFLSTLLFVVGIFIFDSSREDFDKAKYYLTKSEEIERYVQIELGKKTTFFSELLRDEELTLKLLETIGEVNLFTQEEKEHLAKADRLLVNDTLILFRQKLLSLKKLKRK